MCGACPGGGQLSEDTLFLAQRVSPARTAQVLTDLTGGRLRVAALGDGWSVTLPTGGMSVATSFEDLARVCAPYADAALLAAAGTAPAEADRFIAARLAEARAARSG